MRGHVRQDIHSVIHVSRQLQYLEDLNADYIVLFIPAESRQSKIDDLNQSIERYDSNWKKLRHNLSFGYERPWYDRWLHTVHNVIYGAISENSKFHYSQEISNLSTRVHRRWRATRDAMQKTIFYISQRQQSNARFLRDTQVKEDIKQLRNLLADLNKIIGEQGISRYNEMALIAQKTQWGIIGAEIFIFLVTVLIAFIGARRLTKPIETLKEGVNRMAMQDYNITIRNKPNDEIGELGATFEQLSTRLRENESYKDTMLSQFTHEMKSPLSSIRQATRLLEQSLSDSRSPQQTRLLAIINGNYETLQRLITNILHSASYGSGRIKLKYGPVNLVKIATEVLVYLSPTIKEKNMKVNLNFAKKVIEAEADADKLKEVFQNIINNAVKFSRQDSQIDITVKERFPLILTEIRDYGIGIPKKEIPYIFEKLYRASNSKSISVKGTGLGLYIVSQIVSAHGGRITVDSKEGHGTTFTITLPRNRNVAKEGGWLD